MTLDPVLLDFIKGFILPIVGVALFLIQIGAQQRANGRLTFAIVTRLVKKGVFDASDLIELGVLEAAQQSSFSSGDLLKMIAGAVK